MLFYAMLFSDILSKHAPIFCLLIINALYKIT